MKLLRCGYDQPGRQWRFRWEISQHATSQSDFTSQRTESSRCTSTPNCRLKCDFCANFWVNFVTQFSIVFYVNVRCQTLVRIREGWEKRHKMKWYYRLALHKFISLSWRPLFSWAYCWQPTGAEVPAGGNRQCYKNWTVPSGTFRVWWRSACTQKWPLERIRATPFHFTFFFSPPVSALPQCCIHILTG